MNDELTKVTLPPEVIRASLCEAQARVQLLKRALKLSEQARGLRPANRKAKKTPRA